MINYLRCCCVYLLCFSFNSLYKPNARSTILLIRNDAQHQPKCWTKMYANTIAIIIIIIMIFVIRFPWADRERLRNTPISGRRTFPFIDFIQMPNIELNSVYVHLSNANMVLCVGVAALLWYIRESCFMISNRITAYIIVPLWILLKLPLLLLVMLLLLLHLMKLMLMLMLIPMLSFANTVDVGFAISMESER